MKDLTPCLRLKFTSHQDGHNARDFCMGLKPHALVTSYTFATRGSPVTHYPTWLLAAGKAKEGNVGGVYT